MERILQRWYDMISIRSVNGHEAQMADYVANVLRELGMDPHYSYFEEDTARERPSVWSVLDSGRPGKTVLLIGHIDTVGVSDRWKTDPFTPTEIDGKVYGRGAMDMKGGLAAILETLTYYAAHLDEINGKILACFVADEEGLSKGTYQLVAEDVIHADYAIMGECRYDNVAVGFRGRYSFEVTIHGKSAHASHYPEVGENALISGGRLAAAIEALPTLQHPHLKHGTWCVRYMEGGNPGTLVVPEKCYLFVDRYVVPGETDETCIAQIMEAAEQLGREPVVVGTGGLKAGALEDVEADLVGVEGGLLGVVVGADVVGDRAGVALVLDLLAVTLHDGGAVAVGAGDEDHVLLADAVAEEPGKEVGGDEDAADVAEVEVLVAVGHAARDDGAFGEGGTVFGHRVAPLRCSRIVQPS